MSFSIKEVDEYMSFCDSIIVNCVHSFAPVQLSLVTQLFEFRKLVSPLLLFTV